MTLTEFRIEDTYPTRIDGAASRLQRSHPTVWGSDLDGPMDAATLRSHAVKGYSTVDGMLSSDEVRRYRRELDRLAADERLRSDDRVITEPEAGEVRSIFAVHELSDAIGKLVRDPRLVDRARQILGSDIYLHQTRVNYMPGFAGKGFGWHSDFETWHAEDGMPAPRAVSCSIALTDNFPFNGSLMLMPGSHRTFVQCVGYTPEEHYKSSLKQQKFGVPSYQDVEHLAAQHGIEQFTGKAGSALWFDCNIMHGSGNNITPYPRANIFLVFNSVHNRLVEPFAASEPRPTFIAHRDATPLTR